MNTEATENTEAEETTAAEKPKKEPKPKQPSANGITMPGEGTKTRAVWDTASKISNDKGRPALSDEVHEALSGEMEKATISTQYNRWCKFYAVTKEQRKAARDAMKPAKEEPATEEAAE